MVQVNVGLRGEFAPQGKKGAILADPFTDRELSQAPPAIFGLPSGQTVRAVNHPKRLPDSKSKVTPETSPERPQGAYHF